MSYCFIVSVFPMSHGLENSVGWKSAFRTMTKRFSGSPGEAAPYRIVAFRLF